MEVIRAKNGNSTTLDSTLTLIDTISYRLQLLSHDYRGLNDLKLELNLLHKLLLRATYLRSNQSFILVSFSEELRHFYLLLRSEQRLLYVMVEEIARFRESVKCFQRQFCEWNTCILDAVLDKLQRVVSEYPPQISDGDNLSKLKVELKLIKVFYLCAINWRNQASHEFCLPEIRCDIYEKTTQFYYHLLTLEDSSVDHDELAEAFSSFRESSMKCCQQQICEFYASISGSVLQTKASPWLGFELFEFLESLVESLGDIIIWGKACDPKIENLIVPVKKIMIFSKNFIRFASLGVEQLQRFERSSIHIHCQVSAINAASLGYMCWFYKDDDQVFYELQLNFPELLEKIMPFNVQGPPHENYVETSNTSSSGESNSSISLIETTDKHIVVDLVDSLLDCVGEFPDGNTSVDSALLGYLKGFRDGLVSSDSQIEILAVRE